MELGIVILAAGQGTRMRSSRPKVLHELAGRSLLEHVCATARQLPDAALGVVYGHGGSSVPETLSHLNVQWFLQAEQKGTGHAVKQAYPWLEGFTYALVLYGDVPLLSLKTLQKLVSLASPDVVGLLTAEFADPSGYGRIIRNATGETVAIVEEKDASPEQQRLCEINTGILLVPVARLKGFLQRLTNANAQGEYYLTDVIQMAVEDGMRVATVSPAALEEVQGVNTKSQLAELERYFQLQQARTLLEAGVTLLDPARFDLRGSLSVGTDVVIDANVVFEGQIKLGNRVRIAPNNCIRDTEIGDDVIIQPNCVIENAVIGKGARIGPFARLRPDARLGEDVHVGNFVEVKNSEIQRGTKINHLSYIGDADVGKNVNIGAGTITCNYDGANKFRTVIGDNVFVGSDTQLIAPVTVGDGATVGAGTTVVKNVPPGVLTLGRARQEIIPGWQRPKKKPKT
jgi:bifunctional UDP-N-acetylglucosamine pyrophosphorylase / glucosamine-1-phosphate N-acetyltransferase